MVVARVRIERFRGLPRMDSMAVIQLPLVWQCQDRDMTKPWMLDELAHAGPEHLDPSSVARFDRKQGYPSPAEDLAILAGQGIGPASTVVDLGAGTGQFALAAARCVSRVVAVDISPAMLDVLRQRAASAG